MYQRKQPFIEIILVYDYAPGPYYVRSIARVYTWNDLSCYLKVSW